MMSVEYYQKTLLEKAKNIYNSPPLSPEVIDAFLKTPRHDYVTVYRSNWDTNWIHVDSQNLKQHLEMLYADTALTIYNTDEFHSTISRPSLFLKMIDLLQLKPGHKIFELGTGSGWSAALMSRMVGSTGKVISLEIIPELADRAISCLKKNGITNVSVINSDAGNGWALEAPYDRAIFTAAMEDFPNCFFDQIKDKGLVIFVFKNKAGGDQLFLLEKNGNHFKSLYSTMCTFIPATGKYSLKEQQMTPLSRVLGNNSIPNKIVHQKDFSWSEVKRIDALNEIEAIKFFFSISAKDIVFLELESGEVSCGILDKINHSLAVIQEESIISYGNTEALKKFMDELHKWVSAGSPSNENLNLSIYPSHTQIKPSEGQWVVTHHDSIFVWSIPPRISASLSLSH